MEVRISEIMHHSFAPELNANAIRVKFASCNYNCKFCDKSHQLVSDEEFLYELKELRRDFRSEAGNVKYIYMEGGESTLQKQAVMFLAKFAKEVGLKVAIRTNGTKPDMISTMIKEDLLDDVVFNFYSPLEEELFNKITRSATFFITENELMGNIRQSLAILEKNNDKVTVIFKSKIVPNLVFRKEHFLSIAEIINNFDNSFWHIYSFNPEGVRDKMLSGVNAPTAHFIDTIKDNVQKEYPNIRML